MGKMLAKTVTVNIPKNHDIRMLFQVATKIAGFTSESKFFYAAAQQVAMELLQENQRRIEEMDKKVEQKVEHKEKTPEQVTATKQSVCSHTDVFRMTSGDGEKISICNECGKHTKEN